MNTFLIIIEIIFFHGLALFCLLKKNERSVFYIPTLFFVDKITDTRSPAVLSYAIISILIIICIAKNGFFFRKNIASLLLIVYFLILLNKSSDLVLIRPYVFSVICLFLLIALIPTIYKKFSAEVIHKELSNACLLILILFILNALASTYYKYSPMEMYGITSGILFGNLWAAAFNTMPLALFIVFMYGVSEKKPMHLIVSVVTFFFIMLTLRRTVIVLSTLGILITLMTLMTREKARMLFMAGGVIAVIGFFVYNNTDFFAEFKERIELRKLDERDLAEEKRFFEYSLLYDDMFVYHAYSPWFGYELFNSAGNYGKGVLAERSLHGDIPNIWHSSGLIGVMLYLMMIGTAFVQALKASKRFSDKLLFFFCGVSFAAYTGSGRYTEVAATLLIFLIVMLPMATSEETEVQAAEENRSPRLKMEAA
jgi:hypothetical protein